MTTNQADDPEARLKLVVTHSHTYVMYGDTRNALRVHFNEVRHLLEPVTKVAIFPNLDCPTRPEKT